MQPAVVRSGRAVVCRTKLIQRITIFSLGCPASMNEVAVRDYDQILLSLGAFLKRAGFAVLTAGDGAEALSIFGSINRK